MTRHLTKVGYANAAPLLGEVVRIGADGAPHTLAIVQGNIANQGDAWTWVLDNLKRAIEDAVLIEGGGERSGASFRFLDSFAATVGQRLAELHVALASDSDDPAFAPAVASSKDIRHLCKEAREQLAAAFAVLTKARGDLDAPDQALAETLLERREAVDRAVGQLAEGAGNTVMIRIHGDFHLGQVLVSQADAYIIDFEGEPLRSVAERRAKSTPLRDVAGFIRSLDYAAASVELSGSGSSPQPVRERQEGLLAQFRQEATGAFLGTYWNTVGSCAALDLSPDRTGLLDLMLVEKAAYEVVYEATNRPKWLPIPLRGLAAVCERLTTKDNPS